MLSSGFYIFIRFQLSIGLLLFWTLCLFYLLLLLKWSLSLSFFIFIILTMMSLSVLFYFLWLVCILLGVCRDFWFRDLILLVSIFLNALSLQVFLLPNSLSSTRTPITGGAALFYSIGLFFAFSFYSSVSLNIFFWPVDQLTNSLSLMVVCY